MMKKLLSKNALMSYSRSPMILNQQRYFHIQKYQQKQESTVIFGLMGIAIAAYGGAVVAESIGNYIIKRQQGQQQNQQQNQQNQQQQATDATSSNTDSSKSEETKNETKTNSQNQQKEAASFKGFFASFFQTGYYEGGFEEVMTKREAALTLGIRESSPKEKVIQAHRKLSLINHPDKGGSPYIAQKINEAKEVLLGTRR